MPEKTSDAPCPVDVALAVVGGRWKMPLVWALLDGPLRYGALRRRVGASERVFIRQLRQLEADRVVHREQYPEVPPRVEYSLTERGRALVPVLHQLGEWAVDHLDVGPS